MCSNTRAQASSSTGCGPSRWRPLAPIWRSMPPAKANGTKQSMNFAPLFRCRWLAALESSRAVRARPWSRFSSIEETVDDLTEAHRIVDQWQAQRPGIPALDLWWLKSRALLAKAEGNPDDYAELAKQYLELCEKLDARGRLDEARQMVNQIS